MTSRLRLLLDFGGTHTKMQVWDRGRLVSTSVTRSPAPKRGPRGEATIDPGRFAAHVLQVVGPVLNGRKSNYEIAISSQMACFLLVDDYCNPLSEIISWQDERSLSPDKGGATPFSQIRARLGEAAYLPWEGLRPGLPLCYFHEMIRKKTARARANVVSLGQFAAMTIFPDLSPRDMTLHSSEAASTGLFDPVLSQWAEDAIKALNLESLRFPNVTNDYQALAVEPERNIAIFVPIGDFQSAIVGSQLDFGDMFIHIATGGQVARLIDRDAVSPSIWENSTFVQVRPLIGSTSLVLTRTHLPAGRLLQSLSDLLGGDSPSFWRQLDDALSQTSPVRAHFDDPPSATFSISTLNTRGIDAWDLVVSIASAIMSLYVKTAFDLGNGATRRLVFSGGALDKLPAFREEFRNRLAVPEFRHTLGEDTSLAGLAALLDSSTQQNERGSQWQSA